MEEDVKSRSRRIHEAFREAFLHIGSEKPKQPLANIGDLESKPVSGKPLKAEKSSLLPQKNSEEVSGDEILGLELKGD